MNNYNKDVNDIHLFTQAKPVDVKERSLLEMGFPKKFLPLFYKLNTPEKIQEYLKKEIVYNEKETFHSFIDIAE